MMMMTLLTGAYSLVSISAIAIGAKGVECGRFPPGFGPRRQNLISSKCYDKL